MATMDKSMFVLELIDRLTAPARAMHKALTDLTRSEESVTKASSQANTAATQAGNAVAAAGAKAAQGAAGFDRAARSIRSLAAARQATQSASWANVRAGFMAPRGAQQFGPIFDPSRQGAAAGGMGPILDRRAQGFSLGQRMGYGAEDAYRKLVRWNAEAGKGIAKWRELTAAFMQTPFGMVLGGLGSILGMLGSVLSALGSMLLTAGKVALAFGAIAAVTFTKQVLEMASFGERSKRALGFITGDKALGQQEFRDAVKLSEDLGTSVEDTVAHYSKLRSMQFSRIEAGGLVRLSADLKAITGDAQSAERALTAMTQIKAKGKLQSEELVGQLAEAGVSTVLVYKELEKLLGKDRKGVLAALQKGQIDSETGLVAIVRALKAKYHVDSFGGIAAGDAESTLGGAWDALMNEPKRAFLRLGEDINTAPLVAGIHRLRDAFRGAFTDGSALKFINSMVEGLAKLIPLSIEFARGFGDGLGSIADALNLGDARDMRERAKEAGKWLADFYANVIDIGKKAIPQIMRAGEALFQGLDVEGLIEQMKGLNFKQLGSDLVVIAKALGEIAHFAAQLVPTAAKGVGFIADPETTFKNATGGTGQLTLGQALNPFPSRTYSAPPPLPEAPRSPALQPRQQSTVINNNIRIDPVYVDANGTADPREVGEKAREGVREAIFDAFGPRNITRAN